MPGLLFGYLASGHCGQDPWLPAAVAGLVGRGDVDRAGLVECVLSLLTAPQRPKSQDVLARIAVALQVRADEIPGGLTYLLGVMATSHGSVLPVLLPLAVESVSNGADLRELSTVVAGRSEVRPKDELLRALQTGPVRGAAGADGVAAALSVLGAGDDAAFGARVARATRRLGLGSSGPEQDARSRGLWDAVPVAVAVEPGERYGRPVQGREHWPGILDAKDPYTDADDARRMGGEMLNEMARGEFDDGYLLDEARRLLDAGRLAVTEITQIFGDLFLSGGLRQGWPVAVAVADAACGAARTPPGLHALLRMLASFAHEVPRQDLPPAIAGLAAAAGETKAGVEARRLGAMLAGCDVDDFVARLRRASTAAPDRPAARGLWRVDADAEPLPSQRRVAPAPTDLAALRAALGEDFNYGHQSHVDVCFWPPAYGPRSPSTGLTNPELVLATTVRAIHQHGADTVRGVLAGMARQYPPLDVVAAIDLWVAGRLDVAAYWRVALRARTCHSVAEELAADPAVTPDERRERLRALPDLMTALAGHADPLILPPALDPAVARLSFLRACESLLLAESNPVVLATPTWADGTLELGELGHRLASVNGAEVGPLDLVQALYRLRAVDPDDVRLLAGSPVRTAPALTSPAGDTTWDACGVVREWVAAGGLPPLAPVAVAGRWTTAVVAPVPWSRCAALPTELHGDPWCWSNTQAESVRLMPRWADRALAEAYREPWFDPRFLPGRASAPLGEPFHDRVLGLLLSARNGVPYGVPEAVLATVLDLARRDRLDPDAAVAAAVGRHAAGVLSLGRLTQGIADVAERGGLRGLWPSALAIATALTEVPAKPSGLPQLLRLLAGYAVEVPRTEVPGALRRFAASAGTTRGHVEARALVAALDGI
jgi:hypothetical protein